MGRAVLRRVVPADSEQTFSWVSNEWYVKEFAGSSVPTPETHRAFFSEACRDDDARWFFAAEWDGVYVGNAGIKDIVDGCGEVWYYIGDRDNRGKGIGTGVVSALVDFARSQGMRRLRARVLEWNVGSIKVLERNGFAKSGEDYGVRDGAAMVGYVLDL